MAASAALLTAVGEVAPGEAREIGWLIELHLRGPSRCTTSMLAWPHLRPVSHDHARSRARL